MFLSRISYNNQTYLHSHYHRNEEKQNQYFVGSIEIGLVVRSHFQKKKVTFLDGGENLLEINSFRQSGGEGHTDGNKSWSFTTTYYDFAIDKLEIALRFIEFQFHCMYCIFHIVLYCTVLHWGSSTAQIQVKNCAITSP